MRTSLGIWSGGGEGGINRIENIGGGGELVLDVEAHSHNLCTVYIAKGGQCIFQGGPNVPPPPLKETLIVGNYQTLTLDIPE